jgi:endonuclease/exonuclease/phosphatase (EEP) superfamily protein YafD
MLLVALVAGIGVARALHDMGQRASRRVVPMLALTIINLSLLVGIWAITEFADVNQPAVTTLSSIPPAIYILPTLILLCLTLLKSFRSLLTLNVVALACGLFGLMGFRFSLATPAPSTSTVTVMSYDVDNWSGGVAAIADAITNAHPDIVCLQDAGNESESNGPEKLERQMGGYRFVRSGELMIGADRGISDDGGIWLSDSGRAALAATVGVHGGDLHIVDVDLTPDTPADGKHPAISKAPERIAEAKAIADSAKHWSHTSVLCGDLNGGPLSGASRALVGPLADAFDLAGCGFGYTSPSKLPVTRPDHILVGSGIAVQSIATPYVQASGHLPVVAQVSIIPPPAKPAPATPAPSTPTPATKPAAPPAAKPLVAPPTKALRVPPINANS